MTVGEVRKVIRPSSRAIIQQAGQILYIGWFHEIPQDLNQSTVKEIEAIPEMRHRQWKAKNLLSPLNPKETQDYSFTDLQMKLYYKITI